MLKGIHPAINAELMHALMMMGHGDDIVVCDVNHPAATIAAETTFGRLIDVSGCGLAQAIGAILTLMPLDTFVEAPVMRMQVVGEPDRQMPIFSAVQAVVDTADGRAVPMMALERHAFYAAAKQAFAIVRTSDPGPYGCFILRMGVVDVKTAV